MVALSLVSSAAPPQKYHIDKIMHASAFFGLTAGVLYFINRLSLSVFVASFMLFIGGAIEVLQHYVPRRSGTWGDMAADALGIFLAFILARLYHSRKCKLNRD